MTQANRRLSCLILALVLVMASLPGSALAEGYDGWPDALADESYGEASWDGSEAADDEADADGTDGYDEAVYRVQDDFSSLFWDESWEPETTHEGDPWHFVNEGIYDIYEEGDWVLGIDVSEWNGEIDWDIVSQTGVGYAILRCGGSFGWSDTCYSDDQFLRNAQECERLGIPYGVYFYSTAESARQATTEARFVIDKLQGLNPSLPVFIDLEWEELNAAESADTLTEVAETFCEIVDKAGYAPGVYASSSWWEYLLTDDCLDQWAKWAAQYDGYCEYDECRWWQYTHDGDLWGIDGAVDFDIWFV